MSGVGDKLLELSPLHDALSSTMLSDAEEEAALDAYVAKLVVFPEPGRVMEFLAHPLRAVLKKPSSSSKARETSLKGITTLLGGTSKTRAWLALAEELGQSLGDVAHGEEVRSAAVEAIQMLLQRHAELDKAFWNRGVGARGLFGWVLSQLLECCTREQLRLLRLGALESAAILFREMGNEPAVAAAFFPGFVSTVQRVACGDFKQGTSLTTAAVRVLGDAIVFAFPASEEVVATDPFAQLRAAHPVQTLAVVEKAGAENAAFLVPLDEAWRVASSGKASGAVEFVVRYGHRTYCEERDEPSVRVELASFCGKMLFSCSSHIVTPCAKVLVDTLVLYASDEWPTAAAEAQSVLATLAKTGRDEIVQRTVRDSLHTLIISLPRAIRGSIDAEKLTMLRRVTGFASYLGSTALHLVLAVSQATVAEALLQVVSIDRKVSNIVAVREEGPVSKRDFHIGSNSVADAKAVPRLPMPLLYCSSPALSRAAFSLCQVFGKGEKSMAVLLENLLERAECGGEETAEVLLMFSCMVEACDDPAWLTGRIVNVLGSMVQSADVIVLAFASYFIASAAARLQLQFAPFVADCVPLLLSCLGSGDEKLSDAAWSALEQVALAMGEPSVHELIRRNADYVVDKMVKHLRLARGSDELSQLSSLHGILRHSPTNATWLLDDILSEVIALIDASARRDQQLAVFARVLNEIAAALKQLVEKAPVADKKMDEKGKEEGEEVDEEDEYSRKPSPEQAIAAKILDRVRHFVSARELSTQLDSLTCIASCLQVLAQTRKELLPACYAVWDPLMRRLEAWEPLSDDSNILATKIFDVLRGMARLATDFLRGEKFERMWKTGARMCKWALDNHASRPHFAAESFGTSIEHRLVVAMLLCLSEFVTSCGVKDESLALMLNRFVAIPKYSSFVKI